MLLSRNTRRLVALTLAVLCTSVAAGDMFSPLNPFRAASSLQRAFSPFLADSAFTADLIDHVADANARLSIDPHGKVPGYQVIQDDNETTYTWLGNTSPSTNGVSVIGVPVADVYAASGTGDGVLTYTGLSNGKVLARNTSHAPGVWAFDDDQPTSSDAPDLPSNADWTAASLTINENDIANNANWTDH